MASNIVNLLLQVKAAGLDPLVKSAKEFNTNMSSGAAATNKISAKSQPSGGSATLSKAREMATTPQENIDYGIQRSIKGTGAAGRDFAQQSQGLGGLVRVYATFAANVFAVSAAFNALSKAADTANLIKGLDQLGAASGKNLSFTAKQLVAASDGAISLADAMRATAKASAAGLGAKQIAELGQVAQKASIALGRNMSDSYERLSTGIAKMQPELLDELGLYTRIEPAVKAYSMATGRAASSLTEFERRQAFANAAIKEGQDKFSSINIDINPYAKLSASFDNLAQTGLTLVNNVLNPIVGFLAQSPTALLTVIGTIGSMLLKQAIPAIGQYKDALEKAAGESLNKGALKSTAFKQISANKAAAIQQEAEAEADAKLAAFSAAEDKLKAISKNKLSARTQGILGKSHVDVTKEDLAYLDSLAAKNTQVAGTYKELGDGLRNWQSAERENTVAQVAKDKATQSANAITVAQKKANRVFEDQASTAVAKRITANAAAAAEELGYMGSLKKGLVDLWQARKQVHSIPVATGETQKDALGKDKVDKNGQKIPEIVTITDVKLKGTTAALEGFKLVAGTAVKGVLSLVSGLGTLGMVASAAALVFDIIDSKWSTNAKQLEEYSNAIAGAASNLKLTGDVLYNVTHQSSTKGMDFDTYIARANAASGATEGLSKVVETFDKVMQQSSGFDRFTNFFASIIGNSVEQKFAQGMTDSVMAALSAMTEGPAKQKAEDSLREVLGITDAITKESIKAAASAIRPEELLAKGKAVKAVVDIANTSTQKAAASLQGFDDAMKKLSLTYTAYLNTLMPTDNVFKLGQALEQAAVKFEDLYKNPMEALTALNKLLKDTATLSVMSPDSVKSILDAKSGIEALDKAGQNYETTLITLRALQAKAQEESKQANIAIQSQGDNGTGTFNTESAKSKDLSAGIEAQKALIAKNKEATTALLEGIRSVQDKFFTDGRKYMDLALNNAKQLASIDVRKAITAGMSGTGTADAQFQLAKETIAVERNNLEALHTLNKTMTENNLVIKAKQIDEALIENRKKLDGASPQEKENLMGVLTNLYKEQADNKSAQGYVGGKQSYASLSVGAKGEVGTYAANEQGYKQGMVGINTKTKTAEIERVNAKLDETLAIANKITQAEIDRRAVVLQTLSTISAISPEMSAQLEITRQTMEIDQRASEKIKQLESINQQIKHAEERVLQMGKEKASLKTLENYMINVAALKEEKKTTEEIIAERDKLASIISDNSAMQVRVGLVNTEIDRTLALEQTYSDIKLIGLGADKDEVTRQEAFGVLSAQMAAAKLAALDTEMTKTAALMQMDIARADNQKRLMAAGAEASAGYAAAATLPTAQQGAANAAVGEVFNKKVNDSKSTYNSQVDKINAETGAKLKNIEATKAQQIANADLSDTIKVLADVFGDFATRMSTIGSVLGEITASFTGLSKANKEYANASASNGAEQASIAQQLMDGTIGQEEGINSLNAAQAKGTQLDLQHAKTVVDADAKMAGSAKKMFNEKTGAYKLFAGIEKAMHVAKLAMWAKETIMGWTVAGESVAQSMTKAGGNAITAITGAFAAPWPVGIVAGAAMIAIMASIMGNSGKKVNMSGMTAADRQETQGTGTSFVNGQKVDNGNGTFGDTSAKSESIKKSLETMKATSVEGLSNSNSMVKLLTSIDQSVSKAAVAAYIIPGIRAGSLTDTIEGSASSGGGKDLNTYKKLLNGDVIGSFVSSIFGNKSSTSITDSGIKLTGSILDLAKGVEGSSKAYQDVLTETSKSAFGITYSRNQNLSTEFQALGTSVETYIQDIFGKATTAFQEIGKKIGMSEKNVLDVLSKVGPDKLISLRGLTGDAFDKEFNAVISSMLDEAANNLVGALAEKYRKFGEAPLQTVLRVIDSNDKVNLALKSMGKATIDTALELSGTKAQVEKSLTKTIKFFGFNLGTIKPSTEVVDKAMKEISFNISEAMVNAAGSLETFISQSKNFNDNFLTEAERLAPIQSSVNDSLKTLGYTGIDTRKKFKDLVLGLDLTTETGRSTYQSLMDVADSFAKVYPAVDKSLTVEDLRTKLLSDEVDIQKTLGNIYKSTLLARQEELAQLALYPAEQAAALIANKRTMYAIQDYMAASNQNLAILKAQKNDTKALNLQRQIELAAIDDRLRPGQEYINALNDETSILDKLTKARDAETTALETTISGVKASIDTLKKYKTALLGGSSSTQTNQQKYANAKTEVSRLLDQIQAPATTDVEKATQKAAIDSLSSAADTFLQNSQQMYASSAQYTSDFNYITGILDQTTNTMAVQQSDAEMQLAQLKSQTAFLDSIVTASDTTASLLVQLNAAQTATALAQAALPSAVQTSINASSVNIMADLEAIANTLRPTADNTNNTTTIVMQMDALILQVQTMSNEITTLRAEQAAQTAAIIGTNVVATADAANTVAGAVQTPAAIAAGRVTYQPVIRGTVASV
jgi:hypothetical protein